MFCWSQPENVWLKFFVALTLNQLTRANICAELLKRWTDAARDPGAGVCEWWKFGANAGLSADPTGIDGVFPRADDKTSPSDCLFEEFVAHSKAAQDDEDKDQIRQYADQGWLEQTSREELERSYGRGYAVSDFCVFAKEKQGKVKKRLILDLKRSGISNRTRKAHGVTLPRLSDLIQDILQLLATRSAEQGVEVFVARSRSVRIGLCQRLLADTFGRKRTSSFHRVRRC